MSSDDAAAQIADLKQRLQRAGAREAHHCNRIKALEEALSKSRLRVRFLEDVAHRAAPESLQEHDQPPILLAALPRSGSRFLYHSLWAGLSREEVRGVPSGIFPDVAVNRLALELLRRLGGCAHTHISANRANLIEIGAHQRLEKLIVHVRDPRQSMVSMFHYMPDVVTKLEPSQALHYGLPDAFLQQSIEQQLDWYIDNWLPWSIRWIEGWLGAVTEPWFCTRILYTRFEDMVQYPELFFAQLLDFYEIDRTGFNLPTTPTRRGDRNFRLGQIEEWRDVLNPAQRERASALIPQTLLDRFGWSRC